MNLQKENDLRVITVPEWEPALRQKSKETTYKECIEKGLLDKLQAATSKAWIGGQGLAAVQIGVHLRVAFYKDPRSKGTTRFLINPKILHGKDLSIHMEEGCLSIPDKRFNTYRFREITYQKLVSGKMEQFTASGTEAQIIQHEVDHMDGILCCDRTIRPDVPGRNDICPCGSEKKYKKCCLEKGVPL